MSGNPNILVTGTPGTGKTSLCEALAERLGRLIDSLRLLATVELACEGLSSKDHDVFFMTFHNFPDLNLM